MIFTHFLCSKYHFERNDGRPLVRYAATKGCVLSTTSLFVFKTLSKSELMRSMIKIGASISPLTSLGSSSQVDKINYDNSTHITQTQLSSDFGSGNHIDFHRSIFLVRCFIRTVSAVYVNDV